MHSFPNDDGPTFSSDGTSFWVKTDDAVQLWTVEGGKILLAHSFYGADGPNLALAAEILW